MTEILERQLAELSRRLDTTADERLLPGDVLARIAAEPSDDRVAAATDSTVVAGAAWWSRSPRWQRSWSLSC